jgi:hypothetical protein
MKIFVTFSSEVMIHVCQITRRHISEYRILTNRRHGSLKHDVTDHWEVEGWIRSQASL